MSAYSRSVFRPLIAAGAVVALSGGSLLMLAAPASAISPGCALPPAVAQSFAAGSSGSYVVPANVYTLDVVAEGGAGGGQDVNVPGGAGAEVTTTLTVTPGESLAIDVATSSSSSVGGLSGGAASGGAGSITLPSSYSGGGGGGSFISQGSTVLVAAGGGGGAASVPGGSAVPSASVLVAAGIVTSGGDGVTADATLGHGGTGGSAVPGTGGASASGYGVGPGFDGVGEVGGNSFDNPSGGSVGAGGGGGGFAGGGGGGGGGYGNGGGAGSSFSTAAYAIAESTAVTPTVAVTPEASPVFTTAASTSFLSGVAGTFSLCAASPVAVTLSETGGLPSGVVFTDNGDGTATLAGTSSALGTFPITVTASGANGSSAQSFSLAVDPPGTSTVTFDSAGGSSVTNQTVTDGDVATAPADPTRAGYTFEGWFTAATGGTLWDFTTGTITTNTTLYAQWTAVAPAGSSTVTFDSAGGTSVADQTVTDGALATAPADPTRAGYTFDGWFTAATGGTLWDFATGTITSNITLHAQWTEVAISLATTGVALAPDLQGGLILTLLGGTILIVNRRRRRAS